MVVLFRRNLNAASLARFNEIYRNKLKEGYCVVFTISSPITECKLCKGYLSDHDLGKTIEMDLESEEVIWNNITPKIELIYANRLNGLRSSMEDLALFDQFMKFIQYHGS